jgi:eukaryotic translation initiation factor 2C
MAGPTKKRVAADQQKQHESHKGSSSGDTSASSKPHSSAPPTNKPINRVLQQDGYDGSHDRGSRDQSPSSRHSSAPSSPRLASAQPASPRLSSASPRSSSPAPSTAASVPRPMPPINKNLDLSMMGWDVMRGYDKSSSLPSRPAPCKLGSAAKVALNTFNVIDYPSQPVYSYEVMVGKGDEKRGLIKAVWESRAVQKAIGDDFIWDGNVLAWSTRPLEREIRMTVDLDQDKGKAPRPGKSNVHRFAMRQTGTVRFDILRNYLARKCDWDMSTYEAINFLDHLLRDGPSKRLTSIKRNFFARGEQRFDLGGGVEAFKGVYQSLRMTHGLNGPCLSINVDVANGTFFNSGPLPLVAQNLVGARNTNDLIQACCQGEHSRAGKGLKRLRKLHVTAHHRGGQVDDYVIEKISHVSAKDAKFNALGDNGKEYTTTVYEYFLKKHNTRLQFPDLPVVKMTKGKNTLLPMELLKVKENQRYPFKCDERQTSNMSSYILSNVFHGLEIN